MNKETAATWAAAAVKKSAGLLLLHCGPLADFGNVEYYYSIILSAFV
jgi:hypothetical protein